MGLLLEELDRTLWVWHDASIHLLSSTWAADGSLSVCLRCAINAEESRQPLLDLGIRTALVDATFSNVWRVKLESVAELAAREVVLDWVRVDPSPLIQALQAHGMATDLRLVHHQIRCSGGSTFDIVCEQLWLDEVAKE